MGKTLKSSSHIYPIDPICRKCNGEYFQKDSTARQNAVIKNFGIIPSDCVSSNCDGVKCPFITGKAFEHENKTQKISQNSVGYSNPLFLKNYC